MLALKSAESTPANAVPWPTLGQSTSQGSSDPLYCISRVQEYYPKKQIHFEGDDADHVFEVIEGLVKLYKLTPDGRCQVTGFLYPGQLFGLAYDGCYVHTAEAITAAKICQYPRARFESITDEHPVGRKSATEKLASFLLRLSEDAEQRGQDPEKIYIPMSRNEIGDYLGLTTETVSRILGRLKDHGVVEAFGSKHIVILDLDRLTDLAESEEPYGAF
jgi:CRP/FNR family transcriptional regulator